MSNILELNDKLFQVLEGLENDTMDIKKAQAIVNVSNAINNNAKLMIQAAKLSKNPNIGALMIGDEKITQMKTEDLYKKKLEFSLSIGYNDVASAIGKIGKNEFERKFNKWTKS